MNESFFYIFNQIDTSLIDLGPFMQLTQIDVEQTPSKKLTNVKHFLKVSFFLLN
jgi:hypothetical protein